MTEAMARAAAIRDMLTKPSMSSEHHSVGAAIASCCEGLIEAGEYVAALELLEMAQTRISGEAAETQLKLEVLRAILMQRSKRNEDSLENIRRLLADEKELLRIHRHLQFDLMICEGANLWQLNRADEAVAKLSQLRAHLLSEPDSAYLAFCSLQLGSAELVRGSWRAAKTHIWDAIVSARRCGATSIEGSASRNLGILEKSQCRWASAREAAEESLDAFARCGNRMQANESRRSLGIIAWKRGFLGEAIKHTEIAISDAIELSNPLRHWYASLLKGMILLHAGGYEAAQTIFTSGTNWDVPRAQSRPSLLTTEFLGDVHLEQGHAEPALLLYDEVWPQALALVPKGDIVAELRRRRAECYLLLGRHQEAYDEANSGLGHCRELGDRYEEAATYRVLALSAAALGKADEAKRLFEQGFAYYDDIETPYEWGKLWLAYGDWLRGEAAGHYADLKGALEAYQAARDHFDRMGAAAKLDEANARIAGLVPLLPKAAVPAPASPEDDAAEHRRPQRRPRGSTELEQRSQWARETFGLITRNKHMLNLLEDVRKLARSTAPILVLGESGTGKELVARGLHRLSERPDRFIPINCGALPREIIESELFGYIAGAFTGANKDKPGLFEECGLGTIFLDEIGEMSVELQSRLLRVLESGEIRRVGSSANVSVRARVLAATNRDRGALQRGESFRQDLYYRLAHAVIVLTPLRKRVEDVDLLVDHFLNEICEEEQKIVTISADARLRMQRYAWPGNVRQLRSTVRRSVLLASPGYEITGTELELDDGTAPTTLFEELEQAEKRRILEALRQARGSKAEAAKMLGMPRTTLLHKLKRFGIG